MSLPILHGDKIADDADALQAIIDGRPFQIAQNPPFEVRNDGDKPRIIGGEFRVGKQLHKSDCSPSAGLEYFHFYGDPGVNPRPI